MSHWNEKARQQDQVPELRLDRNFECRKKCEWRQEIDGLPGMVNGNEKRQYRAVCCDLHPHHEPGRMPGSGYWTPWIPVIGVVEQGRSGKKSNFDGLVLRLSQE